MTFNLWRGGIQVDFTQVAAAIRAAAPDVVALQEPEGNTRRLADMLGWSYADEGLHLISRFPIFRLPLQESPEALARHGAQSPALIELSPGRVVALVNLHLPPFPDDRVKDPALIQLRKDELAPHLARLQQLAAAGIPSLLVGDFNEASHRDRAAADSVLALIEAAGFRDSYREVHPDPRAKPGITWSPGCPHPRPYPNLVPDRIDFILSAGPVRTLASRLVGEPGGPDVEIGLLPWPSDHRAVVSDFDLQPAFSGDTVTVDRAAVAQGEAVVIRTLTAGDDAALRVGISDAAGNIPTAMTLGDSSDRRAFAFGTATLKSGSHDAVLLAADNTVCARRRFWVLDSAQPPDVAVTRSEIARGEKITVSWSNAPTHRYDWLGIFVAQETDPERYLAHRYTGAVSFGTTEFEISLNPGRYELRLMRDDAYVVLAATDFTIR